MQCEFGFSDFWLKVLTKFRAAFDAVGQDLTLATKMFNAANSKLSNTERVCHYMLASITVTAMQELIILSGNGAGVGAMKIARGMFEYAVMAEYLRTHPQEIDDYAEFRHVTLWNRMQDYPDAPNLERAKEIENNFDRVKARFEDKKGRIRNHWNRVPIRDMACAVGRKEQYEKVYRIAASMHHGNFEAFLSHTEKLPAGKERIVIDDLPSFRWVEQALVSGHVHLLEVLETFNEVMQLKFGAHLSTSNRNLQNAWRTQTQP